MALHNPLVIWSATRRTVVPSPALESRCSRCPDRRRSSFRRRPYSSSRPVSASHKAYSSRSSSLRSTPPLIDQTCSRRAVAAQRSNRQASGCRILGFWDGAMRKGVPPITSNLSTSRDYCCFAALASGGHQLLDAPMMSHCMKRISPLRSLYSAQWMSFGTGLTVCKPISVPAQLIVVEPSRWYRRYRMRQMQSFSYTGTEAIPSPPGHNSSSFFRTEPRVVVGICSFMATMQRAPNLSRASECFGAFWINSLRLLHRF
jgi:hypothetical protein